MEWASVMRNHCFPLIWIMMDDHQFLSESSLALMMVQCSSQNTYCRAETFS
jgi:hypothetical protein